MEKVVFSGDFIRATAYEVENAQRLVVLFDHRRDKPGFPAVKPAEFVQKRGASQVRITLANMDYYLNPDLPDARIAIHGYAKQFSKVSALGFSLGGFGSLLFAKAMGLRDVTLVSPQRPGFPASPVWDQIDWEEEARVYQYHSGNLGGLPADLKGCVLFDPWFNKGRDRTYARVLSRLLPSLSLVALPGAGHPATAIMHKLGRYDRFATAFMDDEANPKMLRAFHGETRMLNELYLEKLQRRLHV